MPCYVAVLSRFSSEGGGARGFFSPFLCLSPTIVTGNEIFRVHSGDIYFLPKVFFSSPGNQNETERIMEEDEGSVLDARNFLPRRKSLLYVRLFKVI